MTKTPAMCPRPQSQRDRRKRRKKNYVAQLEQTSTHSRMGPPQDAIGNELVSAFPLAAIRSRCFRLRVAERATEHAPYRTGTNWTGVLPVYAFQFENANGRENGGTDEKRTYALKPEPQGESHMAGQNT